MDGKRFDQLRLTEQKILRLIFNFSLSEDKKEFLASFNAKNVRQYILLDNELQHRHRSNIDNTLARLVEYDLITRTALSMYFINEKGLELIVEHDNLVNVEFCECANQPSFKRNKKPKKEVAKAPKYGPFEFNSKIATIKATPVFKPWTGKHNFWEYRT